MFCILWGKSLEKPIQYIYKAHKINEHKVIIFGGDGGLGSKFEIVSCEHEQVNFSLCELNFELALVK